jgi:hypothetical protein
MLIPSDANWLQLLATWHDSAGIWGRFDHQRQSFGAHEMLTFGYGVISLLVIIFIWYAFVRHRKQDFQCNSDWRLFGELCRAHRLDRSKRRLLKRLAAVRGLKTAASLFVEPSYFDIAGLPPVLKSAASEYRQLCRQLFD